MQIIAMVLILLMLMILPSRLSCKASNEQGVYPKDSTALIECAQYEELSSRLSPDLKIEYENIQFIQRIGEGNHQCSHI